ncbi:fimbrillin family protein [Sphingobacterium sp. Lzh-3]|uniref:fimbrillin family protein n=1 Tax=Sphingobacterium sp. Lzh-3 TaxID=3382150 RepID=UPI00398D42EC
MKLKNTKTLLSLMIAMTIFIFSCKKENSTTELPTGNAIVNVKINGIAPEDGSKKAKASIGGSSAATAAVQQITVPFGEDLVVRATLTEVKASQGTALRASATKAATTSTGAGELVAFNGNYKIYIYKEGSSTLERTVDGRSAVVNKFELAPGKYKFVVSAYGNPAGTGADRDPLAVEILQTVTAGNNNLDVVLKHKLTEVTVKFDAGSGRKINAISNSTVKPNYNYTFDETTGLVTFGTELAAKGFSFPTQAAAQTWTSSPVMIAVDNSNGTGEVKLASVTINNKPGNVSLTGLTLRKGVQYVLELNLGAKQGIEAGGETWSDGNLEYDPSTGTYSFGAKNSAGNYWFSDRIKPKVVRADQKNYNQQPSDVINGTAGERGGDPCALVKTEGTWRLPTTTEITNLVNSTAGSPPSRWQDNYDGTANTIKGVFFGVNTAGSGSHNPGVNRDKYVFFPFMGYYSNDDTSVSNTYNSEGSYVVKDTDGTFKHWAFQTTGNGTAQPAYISAQFANPEGRASQIRCVKN